MTSSVLLPTSADRDFAAEEIYDSSFVQWSPPVVFLNICCIFTASLPSSLHCPHSSVLLRPLSVSVIITVHHQKLSQPLTGNDYNCCSYVNAAGSVISAAVLPQYHRE